MSTGSSFRAAVQKGKVRGPIQQGFSADDWQQAYERLNDGSVADARLKAAGRWFNERLQIIRSLNTASPPKGVSHITRMRRAIGFVNRDAGLLSRLEPKHDISPLAWEVELTQRRIELPTGNRVAPDGFVETAVDALRFVLVRLIEQRGSIETEYRPSEELRLVYVAANLATVYHEFAELWDECVWAGCYIEEGGEVDVVESAKSSQAVARALSNHLRDVSMASEIGSAMRGWDIAMETLKDVLHAKRPAASRMQVRGLVRSGKRNKLVLGIPTLGDGMPIASTFRKIASRAYLEPLLDVPLPRWPGISVRLLLDAWEVLAPLGMSLLDRAAKLRVSLRSGRDLEAYAPIVPKSEVVRALQSAMKLDQAQARLVLDRFTWSETLRHSLWQAPFVSLSDDALAIVVPTLAYQNLTASVEWWLREGVAEHGESNHFLQQCGAYFERHLRSSLRRALAERKEPFLHAGVLDESFELWSERGKRVGELDVVAWIGNCVLIAEAKCQIIPFTPRQHTNYTAALDKAAAQLRSIRRFVEENPEVLRAKLRASGYSGGDPRLVWAIITNASLGIMTEHDGFPVVTESILVDYFSRDSALMFGLFEDGTEGTVELPFYSCEEQAAANLEAYLRSPPHLAHLLRHLQVEVTSIPVLASEKQASLHRLSVSLPIREPPPSLR